MQAEIRIAHSADFHLGNPWTFLDEAKAACMREVQEQGLLDICRFAAKKDLDFLTIGGDLFDHLNQDERTLQRVADALASAAPCRVVLIPGNHDPLLPGSLWERSWPANVSILDGFLEFPEKQVRFYGEAFRSHSVSFPLLGDWTFDLSPAWINILLQHGDLVRRGEKSNYNPISRERLAESGFDLALLGHIHQCLGPLSDLNCTYLYPGCPLGRGFDECGEKGFFYGRIRKDLQALNRGRLGRGTETPRAELDLHFFPLPGPRFQRLRLKLSKQVYETQDDLLGEIREGLKRARLLSERSSPSRDLLRLELSGYVGLKPNILYLRTLLAEQFFYLELRDETLTQFEANVLLAEHSLLGDALRELSALGDVHDDHEASLFWPGFENMPAAERELILTQAFDLLLQAVQGEVEDL